MKQLNNLQEAVAFIMSHLEGQQVFYLGGVGLERTKRFLTRLGNPEEKLKVVHVAGTSGKGSTCYLTSLLLQSQGFTVGLHQSPHLLDVRERFMINGQLISGEKLVSYLNQIMPIIEEIKPTYFELLTALSFYIFAEEKVDYAIMEVGVGGFYDSTNTIDNPQKLAIITSIGFDHTKLLGKTLSAIASQKAGIIRPGNQVITVKQKPQVMKVFEEAVHQAKADYQIIDPAGLKPRVSTEGTTFYFHGEVKCGLIGDYQARNCALALAAVMTLSKRDGFTFDQEKALKALAKAHFPGRLDIQGKIIIDGAHNPQKMRAFLQTIRHLYPGKKFTFLLAFKKGKSYEQMLKLIIPLADNIIITSFFQQQKGQSISENPQEIVPILKSHNFTRYQIIKSLEKAIHRGVSNSNHLIITGSLYFISEIYPLIETIDRKS